MLYLITKALISGVIIAAASEASKRSPTYGALLVSLPLISILAMIWLWRDTGDGERTAALSEGTFWLVLPTLPMFLREMVSRSGPPLPPVLAVWLLPKLGI